MAFSLWDVPESSLVETLSGLQMRDILAATSCDRKCLHAAQSISHLPAISKTSFKVLSLRPFASRFPKLNSINAYMEGDWVPDYADALTISGRLVRKLVVRLGEGIGETELRVIVKGCPSLYGFELTDYDLMGNVDITGEFLKDLPPSLVELRLCLLRSLDDASLMACAEVCPCLQMVSLEGNDDLSSRGFQALADLQLRDLTLVCTRAGIGQITEETLIRILDGTAPSLRALEVSERAGPPLELQGGGINLVTFVARHRFLEALSLSGVVGLGNEALRSLALGCPLLRDLNLYRPGSQLTSSGLQDAFPNFASLEVLSLGCVADFWGAFQAVKASPLRTLEMTRYFRSAAQVSLLSVLRHLQNDFPSLSNASFRGTFSAEQVVACRSTMELQSCPDVQWTHLDEQTFGVEWFRGEDCVSVQLQRCFKEGEFI